MVTGSTWVVGGETETSPPSVTGSFGSLVKVPETGIVKANNRSLVHVYGETVQEDPSVAEPQRRLNTPDDVLVPRAFSFVDICGFTKYTETNGPPAAFEALRQFRSLTRIVASNRGVRIASWLGDGALLVGVHPAPVASVVCELLTRHEAPLRAGCAYGLVLLFEGDDHIGAAVNTASRLCDRAEPGQVLATKNMLDGLPPWIQARDRGRVEMRHMEPIQAYTLQMRPDVARRIRSDQ